MDDLQKKARTRELNNLLRKRLDGGQLQFSPGVLALDERTRAEVIAAVMEYDFDDDTEDDQDIGTVRVQSHTIVFKIDYYSDARLKLTSSDPSDSARTHRVLSVLLLAEWT